MRSAAPVVAFQSRMWESSIAVAALLPSGEKASASTVLACPMDERSTFPLTGSNSVMRASSLPVASRLPSGEKASETTPTGATLIVCVALGSMVILPPLYPPWGTILFFPSKIASTSYTLTIPNSYPAASRRPSGDKTSERSVSRSAPPNTVWLPSLRVVLSRRRTGPFKSRM